MKKKKKDKKKEEKRKKQNQVASEKIKEMFRKFEEQNKKRKEEEKREFYRNLIPQNIQICSDFVTDKKNCKYLEKKLNMTRKQLNKGIRLNFQGKPLIKQFGGGFLEITYLQFVPRSKSAKVTHFQGFLQGDLNAEIKYNASTLSRILY